MKRRQVLATGLVLAAGCAGTREGSEADGGTSRTTQTTQTTSTQTETTASKLGTDTSTPTPQGEYSPANFRRLILEELNDARGNWGAEPLTNNDVLERLAQRVAAKKPGPLNDEEERAKLDSVGCEEGDVLVTAAQFDDPVDAPGGDGLTRIESPAEYAKFVRKRWMQPDAQRQTVIESEYNRVGIGNKYADSGRAYTVVALCV